MTKCNVVAWMGSCNRKKYFNKNEEIQRIYLLCQMYSSDVNNRGNYLWGNCDIGATFCKSKTALKLKVN